MTADEGAGLRSLTPAQCLALLSSASIGRVVVTVRALPAAFPVQYVLADGAIVFRTSPGTKLTAALDQTVVAFEVDDFDEAARRGWSVLVQGVASVVRDPADPRWQAAQAIDTWGNPDADHVTMVSVGAVSGRMAGGEES